MMKFKTCLIVLAAAVGGAVWAQVAPCTQCHADGLKIKGDVHASVQSVEACGPCHSASGKPFVGKLHAGHAGKAPCSSCHEVRDGNLLVRGSAQKIGPVDEDTFALYAELMDPGVHGAAKLHTDKGLACDSCHAEKTPAEGAAVDNDRCESCHGKQAEIAKKTVPAVKEQNPHQSHQGALPCSKCHAGHSQARSYCLECHQGFDQKMPEGK